MSLEKMLSIAFLVPLEDPVEEQCRWGLNVMLWGEPGIGKSDRVEAAGRAVGLPVRTTYVPTCQPEDVAGTAFMNTSKAAAWFESVIFNLEHAMDNAADFDAADTIHREKESWISKYNLVRHLSTSKLTKRVVRGLADVARQYGPSFSRIESLLPGVSELMLDKRGVWFLDEVSSGRPAVQAGFLGATLMRRVGGLHLPPGIRVVAAGNPPESAAGGWELEPPMANRFCHFDVKTPTAEDWSDWLLNEGNRTYENIEHGEERIRDGWEDHWPKVKGMLSGFLKANRALLHYLPVEGSKERGKAWASPRTWHFAARAWATCLCLGVDMDTIMSFLEGCVGEAPCIPLASWLQHADLPDPLDVLQNGWKIDKTRIDRCHAVYASAISYVTGRRDKEEQKKLAALAWRRLEESINANIFDLTLPFAQSLVRAGLDSKAGPAVEAAARPVLLKLVHLDVQKHIERPR